MNAAQLAYELTEAAHPDGFDERCVTAVFRVYFDESYESDLSKPGFYTVAGCIADKREWRDFTKSWTRRLGYWERKLKRPLPALHMREFVQRRDLSPDEKRAVLTDLIDICCELPQRCFGISAAIPDYRTILVEPMGWGPEDFWFHPYNYCLQGVMQWLMAETKLRWGDRIACYFDRNEEVEFRVDKHFWEIVDYYDWGRVFTGRTSGSHLEYIPLQCADLHAWEINASHRPNFPTRKSFRRLAETGRLNSRIAYRPEIEALAAEFKAAGAGTEREWQEELKRRRRLAHEARLK